MADPQTFEGHECRILRAQRGDTVVVNVEALLSVEQTDRIRTGVEKLVPEGVKVLVLSGGAKIEVITQRQMTDQFGKPHPFGDRPRIPRQ